MKKIIFFIMGILFVFTVELRAVHILELNLDNDVLISDNLYTSGMNWRYSNIDNHNIEANEMDWFNFVIGQKIYTPVDITLSVDNIEDYERPYAGWVYFGFEKEKMFRDKSRVRYEAYMGFVGKYSFAEQTQKTVHTITNSDMPEGWDSQVEEMFGVQFAVKYCHNNFFREHLLGKTTEGFFTVRGEFGNVFMNLSFSQIFKHGLINEFPFIDTWDEESFYIYLEPKINLIVYDATIEGDIFDNNSVYTEDINNIVGEIEIGMEFRKNKTEIQYGINIGSGEIKDKEWDLIDSIFHRLKVCLYF